MSLMSKKMAAALALEGEFSEEGLAAMAGEGDEQIPGGRVQVIGAARHVEEILIFVSVCAWISVMAYVVVWNYLYFTKVLPTLSRDGLDDSPKFMPSSQFAQVDLFLPGYHPPPPRPWYCRVLSRVRAISTAVLFVELVVFMAWVAFSSS